LIDAEILLKKEIENILFCFLLVFGFGFLLDAINFCFFEAAAAAVFFAKLWLLLRSMQPASHLHPQDTSSQVTPQGGTSESSASTPTTMQSEQLPPQSLQVRPNVPIFLCGHPGIPKARWVSLGCCSSLAEELLVFSWSADHQGGHGRATPDVSHSTDASKATGGVALGCHSVVAEYGVEI
jgi:hypothetical protein